MKVGTVLNNAKIRIAMIECNMKHYELARIMGIHEGSLSRKLRDELPEEEQNKIVELIRNSVERKNEN